MNTKHICQFVIALALGCSTSFAQQSGSMTKTNLPATGREAQITTTLKLLGRAENVNVTAPDFATAVRVQKAAEEILTRKTLADGWLLAAQKSASIHSNVTVKAGTTERVAVTRLRDIMGKPDSSEDATVKVTPDDPNTIEITWFTYGWCQFGVSDGQVLMVRAECIRLKPK
jgi:hypothetical protein